MIEEELGAVECDSPECRRVTGKLLPPGEEREVLDVLELDTLLEDTAGLVQVPESLEPFLLLRRQQVVILADGAGGKRLSHRPVASH